MLAPDLPGTEFCDVLSLYLWSERPPRRRREAGPSLRFTAGGCEGNSVEILKKQPVDLLKRLKIDAI